jgi:hypothetical protein
MPFSTYAKIQIVVSYEALLVCRVISVVVGFTVPQKMLVAAYEAIKINPYGSLFRLCVNVRLVLTPGHAYCCAFGFAVEPILIIIPPILSVE